MASGRTHHLDASVVHHRWDNALAPRLVIDAGDTVVFETRDAADGFYHRGSGHDQVLQRVPKGHPLTGPVKIRDAQPGDVLVVEILEVAPRGDFAWSNIRPGRGLLPQAEFDRPYLQVWDLSDGRHARGMRDIAVPLAPFPGVMGTALPEPGSHVTAPPRRNGGNMDIRQLTAGTTLYLPVLVEGALFSIGDGHGAQGDGEVCITAVEMNARATLRFGLLSARHLPEPQFRMPRRAARACELGPQYVTTGHGPDLHECARQAVRHMIDHLVRERGLTREQAYILCSVAVDLRVSEIVDAPNWIVSAFLPEDVFTGG
ncbi:MAG: acetamidase/formamidase family protein [Burkholderiales bacterium]|nr:acetamidase/formamidase family protein [Burkholderiales bacterium]